MSSNPSSSSSAGILHQLVWKPSAPEESSMMRFKRFVEDRFKIQIQDYQALWQWSVKKENLGKFWDSVWDWTNVIGEKGTEEPISPDAPIYPPPLWFPSSKLNFAENLLRHRNSTQTALIETLEPIPSLGSSKGEQDVYSTSRISYQELYTQVSWAVHSLRELGVNPNDTVASYCSNGTANFIAFLACSSVGAVWVSAASDFAPSGTLERFRIVRPKVLFGVNAVRYNGKVHDHKSKIREVIKGLKEDEMNGLVEIKQKLEMVILIDFVKGLKEEDEEEKGWTNWDDFLSKGREIGENKGEKIGEEKIEFERLSFNHPLWILFSSGTTGTPKAITHRSGGMLLQLSKEHLIHGGMTSKDVFFQYTSTGWMMMNFLQAGLVSGATLLLYDGSPLKPPQVLWELAAREGVTTFGTSAAYLAGLEKSGYRPIDNHKGLKVKQVLSTGSPLRAELYPFILDAVGKDVLIGSITGGTDICSLFAGHNTSLPVYAGEIQCKNLGMDIDAFDETGKSVGIGGIGDLVCKSPFPCQPLSFWGQDEQRYKDAYYSQIPGVWYHGDYVMLTSSGGIVMLGRSDGIINAGGIRFGTAEIYSCFETAQSQPSSTSTSSNNNNSLLLKIEDSLVVPLKTRKGDDEVAVIFLQIKDEEGEEVEWNDLVKLVAKTIREKRSARHVPKFARKVKEIPKTLNGKKVEVPVKKIVNGASIDSINRATLQNPGSLDEYVTLGEELRKELAASEK